MCEPKIVHQQDGLYKYAIYEDGDGRWWKIHRPGDETPDYYDEYDGDLIADLLSWLHTQRDKAEAERDALRAEVERLREERDRQYDQNTEQIVRVASLEAEVERLREERRWIPVGERLPDNYTIVTAAWGLPPDRHPVPTAAYCVDGLWMQVGYKTRLQVTHWQPLPAPPHKTTTDLTCEVTPEKDGFYKVEWFPPPTTKDTNDGP